MVLSRTLRGVSLCAAVPIAAGSLALLITGPAHAASLGGVATLAPPGDTAATPLRSGGSASLFTVALPARASCSGDTAHDGYHVYSYLVRKGTDLSTVRFVQGPSAGYGIVNTTSTYYGAVNTAFKTGQIVGVPNDFTWGSLVRSGGGPLALSQLLYYGTTGVWETGLACATAHGAVANDWNTQVTFDADAGDAHGFDWTVDPAASTSTLPNSVGGAGDIPIWFDVDHRGTVQSGGRGQYRIVDRWTATRRVDFRRGLSQRPRPHRFRAGGDG